ncbi:hypothetical protein [Pseudomonas sp. 2FE]|uniref:hypothetical protein n=1 Tax=Pseudomonas sp. 2FE TaxID=2502190 RepID=UPI0010F66E2E|nr:hypothetical protein [Pseudomonas sp. 2FE]
MKNLLSILGIVILTAAIAVGYAIYDFGRPVKTLEITEDRAGSFVIGETKEFLLAKLPEQAYSPQPKPVECPVNWIEVKKMGHTQRQCLLNANEWEVGYGLRELCPEKTDLFTSLFFNDNKLVKIAVRCTKPE